MSMTIDPTNLQKTFQYVIGKGVSMTTWLQSPIMSAIEMPINYARILKHSAEIYINIAAKSVYAYIVK